MQKSALDGSGRVLYTVPEVSQMLAVGHKTVYRLLNRGILRCSSAIRHKRISKESIDEFIRTTTGGAK